MAQNTSEIEAVKNFVNQVRWLYEPEFGDFKRKVGLYIERLEQAAPGFNKGVGRELLQNMKTTAVYNPNGDIESTRRMVIELAERLLSGVH